MGHEKRFAPQEKGEVIGIDAISGSAVDLAS